MRRSTSVAFQILELIGLKLELIVRQREIKASMDSGIENFALDSITNPSVYISLLLIDMNDIATDVVFVWSDGRNCSYRLFYERMMIV